MWLNVPSYGVSGGVFLIIIIFLTTSNPVWVYRFSSTQSISCDRRTLRVSGLVEHAHTVYVYIPVYNMILS